ncbi:hypothetical protein ACUZ9P_14315 [Desulfovibrio sp. QI0430]
MNARAAGMEWRNMHLRILSFPKMIVDCVKFVFFSFFECIVNLSELIGRLFDGILKIIFPLFVISLLVIIVISYRGLAIATDYEFFKFFCPAAESANMKAQDFITILTGILALIIGSTGLGAYLSFRKILKEERKMTDLRKKFEALLEMTEASSFDPVTATKDLSAVTVFSRVEKKCKDYGLLYVLRGEQYYYSGYYKLAIADFEHAVHIDSTLARAWYGWGQALFRIYSERKTDTRAALMNAPLWNFEDFFSKSRQFIMKEFDFKIAPGKATEVVEKYQMALRYGYDVSKIKFEMGRVYQAIVDNENNERNLKEALDAYSASFDSDNYEAGVYYCGAWIRKNYKRIVERNDFSGIDEVVYRLKLIENSVQKTIVYTMLCYLYCISDKQNEARRVFPEANDLSINELFYLEAENSEGAPCSSSPA